MNVNGTSTILDHVCLVIENWFGRGYTESKYWLPFLAKIIATCSLSHFENEHQRSVNDFWSCILGNQNADRLQTVITELLAAIIGTTDCDTLPAPSWKWASTQYQRLLVVYLAQSGGDKLQTVINEVVAAFIGKRGSETLPAPSW